MHRCSYFISITLKQAGLSNYVLCYFNDKNTHICHCFAFLSLPKRVFTEPCPTLVKTKSCKFDSIYNPECKFNSISVAFDSVASHKLASPLLIITFYLLRKFSLALLSPQVLHTTTLLFKECIESVFTFITLNLCIYWAIRGMDPLIAVNLYMDPFIALNLYIYWAIRGMDPLFIRPYRVSINYSPSIKSNDCQGGGWV